MTEMDRDRPNVFIVLLDCVSAKVVANLQELGDCLPNIRLLREESVCFESAAATSPWTVPSHASIFTGLYPWNHGLFAHGSRKLSSDRPSLAALLSRAGYRTFSLSANPFISPLTGLTRGFQTSVWGSWRNLWTRALGVSKELDREYFSIPNGGNGGRPPPKLPVQFKVVIQRYPLFLDLSMRIAEMTSSRARNIHNVVCPWIEPCLAQLLTDTPAERPVFGFVNLLDAHEPYIGIGLNGKSAREYFSLMSVRQDTLNWLRGRWSPSEKQLAALQELYRCTVRTLDRRLGQIFQTIRSAGRWDHTLLFLTSDHGQCFEQGAPLYHGLGLHEDLVRIPFLVRLPSSRCSGTRPESWASLVDILPTVAAETGIPVQSETDGLDLTHLSTSSHTRWVYAMSDGLNDPDKLGLSRDRRDYLDRVSLVALAPGRREEIQLSGLWSAAEIAARVRSMPDSVRYGESSVSRKEFAPNTIDGGDRIDDHLSSWGYT